MKFVDILLWYLPLYVLLLIYSVEKVEATDQGINYYRISQGVRFVQPTRFQAPSPPYTSRIYPPPIQYRYYPPPVVQSKAIIPIAQQFYTSQSVRLRQNCFT